METATRTLRRPGRVTTVCPAPGSLNVYQIRQQAGHIGATQSSFAAAIGVPVKTLRNWEQNRRQPTGPARVLLSLIARDPWIVFDVANNQHRTPVA